MVVRAMGHIYVISRVKVVNVPSESTNSATC
jgi:hypothetical protein